jgi:hypothetical protein
MAITPFPFTLPNQSQVQAEFDKSMAALMAAWPAWNAQVTATEASMSAAAAGSAFALPYVFSTNTADADPGAGAIRLNAAAQNTATMLRADLVGTDGATWTSVLDTFDDSTSQFKGQLRIVKMGDATKWLIFNVTALASPAGYKNITLSPLASSTASPFANGDAVLVHFQRTGDKGDKGDSGFSNLVVLTATQSWMPPAGVFKAELTIIDGGYSSAATTAVDADSGPGGAAGISIIAVNPAITYAATIGAGNPGGLVPGSGSPRTPQPGGASSFSGSGITTLTSANCQLKIPGGKASNSLSGSSLYSPPGGDGIGAGGPGPNAGAATKPGKDGAVIIRY